jgi:uncharacterized membrane-anchored protein
MEQMKKGQNASTESMEGKPKTKKNSSKASKSRKQSNNIHLPFLLELTYTLSTIILILLALAVMVTSFLAGAGLFTVVLRTGVAVSVVGGVLMLISYQISSGLLFSVKIEQEEEQRKLEEAARSMSSDNLDQAEA